MSYTTILFEASDDGVATITLNRPEALNAFNFAMGLDFTDAWRRVRDDDAIRAVVLQANGKAFCSGRDIGDIAMIHAGTAPEKRHPVYRLAPKQNDVWKPVICAVHGLAGGGGFYWITESDFVLCSDDALFFDPHVSYGLAAPVEVMALSRLIPPGEVMRMQLMSLDERLSAQRAYEIGLVTEVVPAERLRERAHELAAAIAAKPSPAVQATVRAMWETRDLSRTEALARNEYYSALGTGAAVDRSTFARPKPAVR
ncbi:MAG: enoyl-CoA hydratase/isomerase family protein [Acidimicrobiia bacterium]